MGKRHDYAAQEPANQAPTNPRPIKLLLPNTQNSADARVDELIFLALESNHNLRTGKEIAKYISSITGGTHSFKQPYISKRIQEMNENGIIARDKLWTIEKRDGTYRLLNSEETEKSERNNLLRKIPFDRTRFFRNDPIRGTIFGFKLIPTNNDSKAYLSDIQTLFNKTTYNNIFQIFLQESTVYILLDTSHGVYGEAVKKLNEFLEEEFLIKK